jgi:Polyketide cyclase / dehydrase and lipid transport
MRTFTFTEQIGRAPADVFAFMMDFNTAPRWRNMVRRMEIVGGGPPRQGSKILVTLDVMGKTVQIESELWLYDPPHRFGQRNTRGGFASTFEYILEPNPSGTRVTYTCDVRTQGLRQLLLPLVIRDHRYRYKNQLATLKRAIEGTS